MKKVSFIILIVFLFLIIFFLIASGIAILFNSQRVNKNSQKENFVIVLDCGHGGPDGGAVASDGTAEKDINLNLGYKLRELLVSYGYSVVMTRKDDNFICDDHNAGLREQNVSDLHNRLKIAESYSNSIFISLHMNKYSEEKYWGSQLFYSPNNKESISLAKSIQKALINDTQKGNSRPLKEMDSSVYIIYNATHPALLLECGFLSNNKELNNFKDNNYCSKFVFDVLEGINNFIGERPRL